MKKYTRGFSLIELIIAVCIVGILAGIAYPNYVNSVRKSHRADAKVALNDVAMRLQRCFTANSTFLDAVATPCKVTSLVTVAGIDSDAGYYTIKGDSAKFTAAEYEISATPKVGRGQEKDSQCAEFKINQSGKKTAFDDNGTVVTDKCW